MQKKNFSILALIAIIATALITWGVSFVAYSGPSGEAQTYTVNISGSTTCYPVLSNASLDFMDTYTNYDITVSSGGSSTGIKNAGEGVSDIGMSSRNIRTSENDTYNNDLVDWRFAADGLAVIFDADATHGVTNLTMEQVFKIYNGTYDTWDDVGGSTSDTIEVVTRAAGSGTRGSFEELVVFNDEELGDNDGYINNVGSYHTEQENPGVASYVEGHPNSIGYVGLGFVNEGHILVKISKEGGDYVTPTDKTVKSGEYPIARYLHMVTLGQPEPHVMNFINYIYSPIGQQWVAEEGFIPLYTF